MVDSQYVVETARPEDEVSNWLEEKAHSVKSARISHALITPGATLEQALVKSTLQSHKQLNGLMFFMAKLEQRGLGLEAEPPLNSIAVYIKRILIGSSSVWGKARYEAIEADASVLDQAAHQTFITGKPALTAANMRAKKGFGFLKKHEDRRDGYQDEQ